MPPRYPKPQFRWVYPPDSMVAERAPEISAAAETLGPSDARERECFRGSAGVPLKPHQISLVARCVDLERGAVELDRSFDLERVANAISNPYGSPELASSPHVVAASLRTRVGIIGDKAGSGKSFVVLGVIAEGIGRIAPPESTVRSFADDRVLLTTHRGPLGAIAETTLIVVPHNLCDQWASYLSRWNEGDARPLRHAIVSRSRHLLAIREQGALDALDVVLVTSTFYNAVATIFSRDLNVKPRRVVFDEADSLVISSMAKVDACFHWFVTATYRNLIFPFGDPLAGAAGGRGGGGRGVRCGGFLKSLWAELGQNSMSRSVSHALVMKNSDAFVDASMRLPEARETRVACRAPASIRVLAGVVGIDRAVMQSLNAGDVESALQHVDPANRGSEDNVVRALHSRLEREAHNLEVRAATLEGLAFPTEGAREAARANLGRKLDDVRRRIATLRERVARADVCSICFESFTNKAVAPCCSNAFCFECVSRWLMGGEATRRHAQDFPGQAVMPGSCPLCKAELAVRDLLVVTCSTSCRDAPAPCPTTPNETSPENDKLGNLSAILRGREPGAKFLVFSSYDNSFDEIVRVLDALGVRHRFLKGNHYAISGIEHAYRDGDLDALLVNTRHRGCGLNLENTTDVIMMHRFDADVQHQVIGRAQRCGRSSPLRIWHLLHENESTH